ncbi:SitI6 family double-CXXCG motif immunity protein [Myxococcus faecalis]|uniref:SitI6 family double-CXXCG motif immunity protein n=1 Tax=Myxococcus faecalis TaxID=3115646 RepID=UPI003CFB6CDC
MRYFSLAPIFDLGDTRWRWSLNAKRRWVLPGTECPHCHAGPALGIDYPSVDLSGLPEERQYRKARFVPWSEYAPLQDRVLPLLPAGAVPRSGMGMGPLVGTARGRPPPVAMDMPWRLFAQPEGVERLLAAGLRGITPIPTAVTAARDVPPLLELELQSGGNFAPECGVAPPGAPCTVCGVQRLAEAPKVWWLDPVENSSSLDLFRFRWDPTVTVVSERFVEVLRSLGDTGIQIREVPTTEPSATGTHP